MQGLCIQQPIQRRYGKRNALTKRNRYATLFFARYPSSDELLPVRVL
jgi:hypothetical protein